MDSTISPSDEGEDSFKIIPKLPNTSDYGFKCLNNAKSVVSKSLALPLSLVVISSTTAYLQLTNHISDNTYGHILLAPLPISIGLLAINMLKRENGKKLFAQHLTELSKAEKDENDSISIISSIIDNCKAIDDKYDKVSRTLIPRAKTFGSELERVRFIESIGEIASELRNISEINVATNNQISNLYCKLLANKNHTFPVISNEELNYKISLSKEKSELSIMIIEKFGPNLLSQSEMDLFLESISETIKTLEDRPDEDYLKISCKKIPISQVKLAIRTKNKG